MFCQQTDLGSGQKLNQVSVFYSWTLDRMHNTVQKVACFSKLSTTWQTVLPAASFDNAIRFHFKSSWGYIFETGLRNGMGVWQWFLTRTCFVDPSLGNVSYFFGWSWATCFFKDSVVVAFYPLSRKEWCLHSRTGINLELWKKRKYT